MIWCRFSHDDQTHYGLVEGDRVLAVRGDPFRGYEATGASHALADVRLLVPVVPPTFYCAGANYEDHIRAYAQAAGKPPVIPAKPDIGYRSNGALIAHGEAIVKPSDSTEAFQYEGELVAVIGRTAKNVSKDEALDCVLGWTIGNDVSERTWQRQDRTFWRSKNADTFKPMGPWIVTGLDPDDMTTVVRLNGEETDRFRTNNMIFDAPTYIAEITRT